MSHITTNATFDKQPIKPVHNPQTVKSKPIHCVWFEDIVHSRHFREQYSSVPRHLSSF